MSKLPKIFHGNDKIFSNNKNSYNTYSNLRNDIEKDEDKDKESFNKDQLINYFNKRINVVLKNGSVMNGVLISKRGNTILLNSGQYINLDDVKEVN